MTDQTISAGRTRDRIPVGDPSPAPDSSPTPNGDPVGDNTPIRDRVPVRPSSSKQGRSQQKPDRPLQPAERSTSRRDGSTAPSEDYEVGYGKPPKEHRFKSGQSGNPKGRPKGSKNFATDIAEVLAELVTVNEGGKKRTVSKQRASIMGLVNRAMRGDPAAMQRILQIVQIYLPSADSGADDEPLPPDQSNLLETFVAERIEKAKAQEQKDEVEDDE